MEHQGKKLREIIDKSGKTVVQVVSESGVSRAQLYILFKQSVIEKEYLDKLSKAKIFLSGIKHEGENVNIEVLRLEIEHLKEKNAMLENEVAFLKSLLNPKIKVKTTKA